MESMVIITRIMTRHGIIMLLSGYVAEMQEEETTRIAACVGKEDFLLHCLVKRGTFVGVCAQVKKKYVKFANNWKLGGRKSGGREGNEFLVCTLRTASSTLASYLQPSTENCAISYTPPSERLE